MINPRVAVPRHYIVVSRSSDLPVDLETVKEHLKLDEDDTSEDQYLTLLIQSATNIGEFITKRDFYIKTYKVFMDTFNFCNGFELRKSPLNSVDNISYYKGGSLVVLDSSKYYLTQSETFRSLYPVNNWPTDVDCNRKQAVEIEFQAGYANGELPYDLQIALLQHITSLYENRGDCSCQSKIMQFLPSTSRAAYEFWRIKDLRVFANG